MILPARCPRMLKACPRLPELGFFPRMCPLSRPITPRNKMSRESNACQQFPLKSAASRSSTTQFWHSRNLNDTGDLRKQGNGLSRSPYAVKRTPLRPVNSGAPIQTPPVSKAIVTPLRIRPARSGWPRGTNTSNARSLSGGRSDSISLGDGMDMLVTPRSFSRLAPIRSAGPNTIAAVTAAAPAKIRRRLDEMRFCIDTAQTNKLGHPDRSRENIVRNLSNDMADLQ